MNRKPPSMFNESQASTYVEPSSSILSFITRLLLQVPILLLRSPVHLDAKHSSHLTNTCANLGEYSHSVPDPNTLHQLPPPSSCHRLDDRRRCIDHWERACCSREGQTECEVTAHLAEAIKFSSDGRLRHVDHFIKQPKVSHLQ